jgi:hypothetical protein
MQCAVRVPTSDQPRDDIQAAARSGTEAPAALVTLSRHLGFLPFSTASPAQLGAAVRQAFMWAWRNVRADWVPRPALFVVSDQACLFLFVVHADAGSRFRARFIFAGTPPRHVVQAVEASLQVAACAVTALQQMHPSVRDPKQLTNLIHQPPPSGTGNAVCMGVDYSRVSLSQQPNLSASTQMALLLRLLMPLRSPAYHLCQTGSLPFADPPLDVVRALDAGDPDWTMRELCLWYSGAAGGGSCFEAKGRLRRGAPDPFDTPDEEPEIKRPAAGRRNRVIDDDDDPPAAASVTSHSRPASAMQLLVSGASAAAPYVMQAIQGAQGFFNQVADARRYIREPLEAHNARMAQALFGSAAPAEVTAPAPAPVPVLAADDKSKSKLSPPLVPPTGGAKQKASLWDPNWKKAYDLFATAPSLDAFQRGIRDLWPEVVERRPLANKCATEAEAQPQKEFLELSKFQEFLRRWFTPNMPAPLKGVLLQASTGTGKTCAAIATASSSFQQQYEVIWWVGTPGVRNERNKNLARSTCSVITRQWLEQDPSHHLPGAAATTNTNELSDVGRSFLHNHKAVGRGWMPSTKSYRQLYNYLAGVTEGKGIKAEVKTTRGKGSTAAGSKDPLYKTLLIIDEAHNIVADDKKNDPRNQISLQEFSVIQKAIWRSWEVSGADSVRVLLMTATPIKGLPVGYFQLLNCVVDGHPFPNTQDELDALCDPQTGMLPTPVLAQLADKMKGAVLYTDATADASRFPVVRRMYHVRVPIADAHRAKLMAACKHADPKKQAACLQRKENSALGQAAVFDGKVNAPKLRKLQEMWAAGRVVQPKDNPFSSNMDQLLALAPKAAALVKMIRVIDENDMKHQGHMFKHLILTRQDQFEGAKFLAFALLCFGYRLTMKADKGKLVLGYLPPAPVPEGSNNFICMTRTPIMGAESSPGTFLAPKPGARPDDCAKAVEDTATPPDKRRGLFNLPENKHGQWVRLAIMDRAFHEGVDIYDTPHCHLVERWSMPEIQQGVGRVTRNCGSACFPFDRDAGWPVNVYIYTGHYDEVDAKGALTGPHTDAASLVSDVGHMALADQLLNLSAYVAVDRLCNPDLNPYGKQESLSAIDLTKPRDPFPLAEHVEWNMGVPEVAPVTVPQPRPVVQQQQVPIVVPQQQVPVAAAAAAPVEPLPANASAAERVLHILRSAGLKAGSIRPPPSDAVLPQQPPPSQPARQGWMQRAREWLTADVE